MAQKSMFGARVRLWVGAALALAGWAAAFVCSGPVPSLRLAFPVWLGLVVVTAVLTWVGTVEAWTGFTAMRYVIAGRNLRLSLVTTSLFVVGSGIQAGNLLTARTGPDSGFAAVAVVGMTLAAVAQLAVTVLLLGDRHGLTMWRRHGLGFFVRIPWADIERVVFTAGRQPKTIEIGVAQRPGAKPRRSSTRSYDVLTDLPCRVVVPEACFDLPALQRLLAEAGRPEIALLERTEGTERVVDYPVEAPTN